MIYVKGVLVGLLTAFAAIVVVTAALLQLSFGEGSGSAFVMLTEWQILIAAVTGFAIGFWLTVRRGRSPARAPLRNV
jgi:hypothetical protein